MPVDEIAPNAAANRFTSTYGPAISAFAGGDANVTVTPGSAGDVTVQFTDPATTLAASTLLRHSVDGARLTFGPTAGATSDIEPDEAAQYLGRLPGVVSATAQEGYDVLVTARDSQSYDQLTHLLKGSFQFTGMDARPWTSHIQLVANS